MKIFSSIVVAVLGFQCICICGLPNTDEESGYSGGYKLVNPNPEAQALPNENSQSEKYSDEGKGAATEDPIRRPLLKTIPLLHIQ